MDAGNDLPQPETPSRSWASQLRRLGDIFSLMAFALLVFAFFIPGSPGLTAIICAHVLLWIGFLTGVAGDLLQGRAFPWIRLAYLLLVGFILVVCGPVVRAAGY